VPVPYSFPGVAVLGQIKAVSIIGARRKSRIPPHFVVRPNSLKAMRANVTMRKITHPFQPGTSYK